MATARGMWDAAKHPHGAHGRWASKGGARKAATAVGRTPGATAGELRRMAQRGKRDLNSVAQATTRMHASRATKAKRVHTASVTTWGPGIWAGRDARIRSSYRTRGANFEVTGHKPMPAGSTLASLQHKKPARRKSSASYSGRHRS